MLAGLLDGLQNVLVQQVAVLISLASFLQPELLSNGSFEAPGFAAPPYFRYLADSDTAIANWTMKDDGIGERPYWTKIPGKAGNGVSYKVVDGQYGLSLNQGTSVRTTFPVKVGKIYSVRFSAFRAGDQPIAEYPFLTVRIDSKRFEVADLPFAVDNPSGRVTVFYRATRTANTTLEILNESSPGDFKAFAIDDVSVKAVPDSLTWMLVLSTLWDTVIYGVR